MKHVIVKKGPPWTNVVIQIRPQSGDPLTGGTASTRCGLGVPSGFVKQNIFFKKTLVSQAFRQLTLTLGVGCGNRKPNSFLP